MKQVFEILVPLALIIVLLMCMMNNNSEEYFSVGGEAHEEEAKCHHNLDDGFKVGGPGHKTTCGEGFKVGGEGHSNSFKVGASHCDSFKVSGEGHSNSFKVGASHCDGFKVGGEAHGNGGNTCHVTMIWADWCGFSKKAEPEFKSLKSEYEGKEVDGCKLTFKQIEEKEMKADPELMKKYKVDGFPTYFCEMNGKHETFNSIEKQDMLSKIKNCIKNLKVGGGQNAPKPSPNKPAPNKPSPNKPSPNKPAVPHHKPPHNKPEPGNYAKAYNSARPTVYGEMLYSSCDDSEYGPVRLDSVSRNLAGVGNSPQEVTGYGDCTELEFAPIKFSTGGPQIPSMNSLKPSLGQLPAPSMDGVQGITRPLAFNKPHGNRPSGNMAKPSGNGNAPSGNSKKARVTMVRADWCGFCKKAMPEWEKLKGKIHDKVVNGYHMVLRDLEQKKDEGEIKKHYSDVNGFPTYVVEVQGPNGEYKKSGTFNSIEMNDMHEKIQKHLN